MRVDWAEVAVPLGALLQALLLLQGKAAGSAEAGDSCACDPVRGGMQLLRGADRLDACQRGLYCSCGAGQVQLCRNLIGTQLLCDEDVQMCSAEFDCAAFFERDTASSPASSEATTAPTWTASSSASTAADGDGQCTCGAGTALFQLIRGDGQLQECEGGYYCDCQAQTLLRCPAISLLQQKYNEDDQTCDFLVDCVAILEPTTTAATTTADTTVSPCACSDGATQGARLVRGEDAVDMCEAGYYCDCAGEELRQCFGGIGGQFDERSQHCDVDFDCAGYLSPSTATSPATTDQPDPNGTCVCQGRGVDSELIRGEGAVELCEQGYHCDCRRGRVAQCDTVLNEVLRFDEALQMCDAGVDCRAILEPTEQSTSSTTTTTTDRTGTTCACGAGSSRFQLVRGDDEKALCEAGYYCDCVAARLERCVPLAGLGMQYDEERQACAYDLDCNAFLAPTTASTGMPTDSPTSPTAAWFRNAPDPVALPLVLVGAILLAGVVVLVPIYLRRRAVGAPCRTPQRIPYLRHADEKGSRRDASVWVTAPPAAANHSVA